MMKFILLFVALLTGVFINVNFFGDDLSQSISNATYFAGGFLGYHFTQDKDK